MHGFMCGLGNRIITYACHLKTFNRARDRVALLTVTVLDAIQVVRKEFYSEATMNNVSPENSCYSMNTGSYSTL